MRATRIGRPVLAACIVVGMLVGCTGRNEQPEPEAEQPDVPEIARGTVGSYVRFTSIRSTQVIGYGLVIGLNNTGSQGVPFQSLRSRLLREMWRAGVEDGSKILDSRNTAAVLVSGTIMPFHTEGSRFDVSVTALQGTQTTSLEGGTLMKTRLAPLIRDPKGRSVMGAYTALAHGPIVVSATARSEREKQLLDKRQGLIVGGGRFSGDRKITCELLDANLRSCLLVEQTINARFPRAAAAKSRQVYTSEAFVPEPGRETGVGEPPGSEPKPVEPPPKETQYYVELSVPPRFAGRWLHFTQVVASLYIDRREAAVQARAQYLIDTLRDDEERVTACYGLEAIGKPCIGLLVPLLADDDRTVRTAAASVLIALGDSRGTNVLVENARDPDSPQRLGAIHALGRSTEPVAVSTLHDLTGSPDVETRYAAYASLRGIRDQTVVDSVDQIHNVKRFAIDTVRTKGPPMIIAQAAGDPRLVFFGSDIRFRPPIFFDEGRYWAIADTGARQISIMPPKPAPRRPLISKEFKIDMNVLDYVILMDQLGATYPDVLNRLQEADRLGRLTADFELRTAPPAVTERTLD